MNKKYYSRVHIKKPICMCCMFTLKFHLSSWVIIKIIILITMHKSDRGISRETKIRASECIIALSCSNIIRYASSRVSPSSLHCSSPFSIVTYLNKWRIYIYILWVKGCWWWWWAKGEDIYIYNNMRDDMCIYIHKNIYDHKWYISVISVGF